MSIKLLTTDHLPTLISTINSVKQEIRIISPFISENMTRKLCEVLKENPEIRCTVITRYYYDNFMSMVSSIEALEIFIDCGAEVYALQDLHTKLYLFDDLTGILGSANFTSGGFFLNHELSILIEDEEEILDDINQYFDKTLELIKAAGDFRVTKDKIHEDMELIKDKQKEFARLKKSGVAFSWEKKFGAKIDFPQKLEESQFDSVQKLFEKPHIQSDIKYFLKPVGSTGAPFLEGRILDGSRMYFSKTYPRAVTKGSILICYGVGTQKLLGYYETTSDKGILDPEPFNERWPHYVESKCLSHNFSEKWWTYDLVLRIMQDEYISLFPNIPITRRGTQSFGALNWGADKIQLMPEFGEFLIGKINDCNN